MVWVFVVVISILLVYLWVDDEYREELKKASQDNKIPAEKRGEQVKITYETENEKKVKVDTYADGTVNKYDENGNRIYHKDSDGYEEWYEYDANGRLIHFKNSNGREKWWEYNSNGKLIHSKKNTGYEGWREYDSNGRMIHLWDNMGYEWFADGYKEARLEISKSLGIPIDFVDFDDSAGFPSSKKFSKKVRRTVRRTQRRTLKKLNRLFKKYHTDDYKAYRKKNNIHWWEFWK